MKLKCCDCGKVFDKSSEMSKMEYEQDPIDGRTRSVTYEYISCPNCSSDNVEEFDEAEYISNVSSFLEKNGVRVEDYTIGKEDLEFHLKICDRKESEAAENILYDLFGAETVVISKEEDGLFDVMFKGGR